MNPFRSESARVRKAQYSDIDTIACAMREADKQEIWDSHHVTPKEALVQSYRESVICLTITLEGRPIGMFGVSPHTLVGYSGTVWLLGTEAICHINKKLLRRSREFVKIMLSYYPHLENFVSIKNESSVRWLKFCGAVFAEPVPYGVEGKLFMRFTFEREKTPCVFSR